MTKPQAAAAAILQRCDTRRVADLVGAFLGEASIRDARPEEMAMACVTILATQARRGGDVPGRTPVLEALVESTRLVFAGTP